MAIKYREFGASLPIIDAIKNKRNIAFLCIGIIFFVDFVAGSELTQRFVHIQFKIQGVDYTHAFKYISIIGTYTDIPTLARMYDKILFIACFVLCGLSLVFNLWMTIRKR